jgi:hypothetical protein
MFASYILGYTKTNGNDLINVVRVTLTNHNALVVFQAVTSEQKRPTAEIGRGVRRVFKANF